MIIVTLKGATATDGPPVIHSLAEQTVRPMLTIIVMLMLIIMLMPILMLIIMLKMAANNAGGDDDDFGATLDNDD